ncbi:uncharacterized protein LOC118208092 [Anguilla anguilla]|uniref:uncharacterized protein LOC118208092 n=1 Tax=Anguilla anguilla TaxID=7936 RepID=UPI0015ADB95A|nr:uncharacterized protein LOC118208092 [Anguilla anguilla]
MSWRRLVPTLPSGCLPSFGHVTGSVDRSPRHSTKTTTGSHSTSFSSRRSASTKVAPRTCSQASLVLRAQRWLPERVHRPPWCCEHKGGSLNVFTGLPGAVHDAQVQRWSSVYTGQLTPPPGWCVIRDRGWGMSLLGCTHVPLQNPAQARYNRHLSTTRRVAERVMWMKDQWLGIFLKAFEGKSTFVPVVVSTCAFLHNLCISSNGDMVEPDVEGGRP